MPLKIELSRWQIRRLNQALALAIDYQESSIGSWRNNLKKSKWRKDIEAFEKLRDILRERMLKEE
jgi:hypothetical protein